GREVAGRLRLASVCVVLAHARLLSCCRSRRRLSKKAINPPLWPTWKAGFPSCGPERRQRPARGAGARSLGGIPRSPARRPLTLAGFCLSGRFSNVMGPSRRAWSRRRLRPHCRCQRACERVAGGFGTASAQIPAVLVLAETSG